MKRICVLILAALLCLSGCRHGVELATDGPAEMTVQVTEGPTEPAASETAAALQEPKETNVPEKQLQTVDLPQTISPEQADDVLVRVVDYIPLIQQELAYATEDNFTGQPIYGFTDAYLRYGTVKKLSKACDELAEQGIGLKIWDGFRPLSAQEKLWEICPDTTYVSHPVTGSRSHCRGSAVDVTLIDLETEMELPMPTGFDDFTALADRDYSDCDPEAAHNALLLEEVMEKYGFKSYDAEWWHYSDTEDYPVEENFDPGAGVG